MASTNKAILFIAGAPTAGKTTLVGELAGTIEGALVFDTDLFGEYSHPEWDAWATNWLQIALAVNDNGLLPVLCGYGLHRPSIALRCDPALVLPSRCLYLDVPESVIRARLAARGGFDEERIDRKLAQAAVARADADDILDTADMTIIEVSERVRAWIGDQI